ncbi:MAG: ankyrin repeat domain-containing protein [Pseudomonadota bacterium]
MELETLLRHISDGRTDLVFELLKRDRWEQEVSQESISPLSWLVYYGDATALRAVRANARALPGLDLNLELNSAAFFGHWKVCDFLIECGAEPTYCLPKTQETALHSALCKAGRPHYGYTVRLLLERGADPNACTQPGAESEAFMRDVRTRGETPLHRAAAFADAATITLLLEHGADVTLKDAHGDTPLSWASWHLRPGEVLQLLTFPPHHISDRHVASNTSDHGQGWGNGMERNLLGAYRPLSHSADS